MYGPKRLSFVFRRHQSPYDTLSVTLTASDYQIAERISAADALCVVKQIPIIQTDQVVLIVQSMSGLPFEVSNVLGSILASVTPLS